MSADKLVDADSIAGKLGSSSSLYDEVLQTNTELEARLPTSRPTWTRT
jgi:hypothetical protein